MSEQSLPRKRGRSYSWQRTVGAAIFMLVPVCLLTVWAAWPIYQTHQIWLVALVQALAAFCTVWLGTRLRWGQVTLFALMVVFVLLLLPVGMPEAFFSGPAAWLGGLGDGLAAVALGWKQLLTLALPLGSYQTVLVPLFTLVFVAVAAASALVFVGGRWVSAAGVVYVLPVLFGTFFGSSAVSAPLALGSITIAAPRELALWLLGAGAALSWIAWWSGRARRQALQRGRAADAALAAANSGDAEAGQRLPWRHAARRNAAWRGIVAAATVVVGLMAAVVIAPQLAHASRTVPRDVIDPKLVVEDRVSPLAAYRAWKRDDTLQAELFAVSSAEGRLPQRLHLAVLSAYDGVDFTIGRGASAGLFARFPSGSAITDGVRVSIEVRDGYTDVWAPISAPLGQAPRFSGPRSGQLADSFYVNRRTGSAIAVPTAQGLRAGDGYSVVMSAAKPPRLDARPASKQPLIDAEKLPELAHWLELQQLPRNGQGVTTAIERLRERGYLSHSLSDGAGESLWLRNLPGMRFIASPGGHSWARIEYLFEQLAQQELAAGVDGSPEMLVAGIGDDEQFAAAAALVARAMGFESRVVLGVRLGDSAAGVPGVPACSAVCRGENLAAWVEVAGADGMWAPFDVSPQIETPPTMLEKGEQLPEFPTQPADREASETDPPVGRGEQNDGDEGQNTAAEVGTLWLTFRIAGLILCGVLLLALLVFFVPLLKKLRRQARRRQIIPELRAVGAWDELLDSYRDYGKSVPAENRTRVMRELGVANGDWIAWVVDQAVYSRESIIDKTADTLWDTVGESLKELRKSRNLWQRLLAGFSFASFGIFTRASGRKLRYRVRQKETVK